MQLQIPGFGWVRVTSLTEYAGGAVARILDITTVADVSGSLNNTYFHIYSANDTNGYTVWFNVNSAGTAPNIGQSTRVEVALATNDTADTVAGAVQSALDALGDFSATLPSGTTAQVQVTCGATGSNTLAHSPKFENSDTKNNVSTTGFSFTNDTLGAIALPSSLIFYRIIGTKQNNYMEWQNRAEYKAVPFKKNNIDVIVTEHQLMQITVTD